MFLLIEWWTLKGIYVIIQHCINFLSGCLLFWRIVKFSIFSMKKCWSRQFCTLTLNAYISNFLKNGFLEIIFLKLLILRDCINPNKTVAPTHLTLTLMYKGLFSVISAVLGVINYLNFTGLTGEVCICITCFCFFPFLGVQGESWELNPWLCVW